MNYYYKIIFYITIILTIQCSEAQKQTDIENYQFEDKSVTQIDLPDALLEISGITYVDGESVYAHNDEMGVIYKLNYNTGQVIKKWQIGTFGIAGDFEDIAYANGKFYLLESNGSLYEFLEGENNKSVSVKKYKSNFSDKYEFEGLCYNEEKNELLMMCKEYSGKKYHSTRPVFSFSLISGTVNPEPVFLIELDELKSEFDVKKIFPSGIAKSPVDNNYHVVSSKGEKVIVEVTAEGKVISVKNLPAKIHEQPEGITFLPDGTIIISDEGVKKRAKLTIYKMTVQE